MPIYEYECSQCGHCFERLMLAGDKNRDLRCPACGAPQIRKRVSCAANLSAASGGLCGSGGGSRFS
mgnify:CR=1 FL=1